MIGLLVGLILAVIVYRETRILIVDRLKWSWGEARRGLLVGLLSGLIIGLLSGVSGGSLYALLVGLFYGLLGGLLGGVLGGLSGGLTSSEVEETTYPGQRLKQTFLNGLFFILIVGLIFALLGGLGVGLLGGVLGGLLGGLSVGLLQSYKALIQHYTLRLLLARHHLLPRQLMPFLEYSVSLIFLRRVGGSYIFIHRLLMEHFAEMEV
jgi:hypothetical protein